MTSANPGESWISRIGTSGYDQQTCHGTIREELFKNYRSRTSEKWKAKEDKIEEAKKQKIKRIDDEWN